MNKGFMGNVLLILGVLVFVLSVYKLAAISNAQHELLQQNQEEAAESPAVLNDSSLAVAAAEVQDISIERPAMKRQDYQSGQLIIEIPKLKVKAAVVQGTSVELLKKGPGLYENSPLPGEAGGNVCIAGHRTTYGAWFRDLDKLEKGDEISLKLQELVYTYQVDKVFIVDKKDWSITEPTGYDLLTLTSCHPLRSSKQRIVVRAELVQ